MISIEEAKEAAGSKTRKARQKMSKIKLLIEIEKKTYELIKDKPDNIAESIIANGTPLPNEQIAWEQGYEAGLVQGKHRPKGEWGKWIIAEIQCPNCFEYFETDCYSTEELNKCPNCGAKMKGGSEE